MFWLGLVTLENRKSSIIWGPPGHMGALIKNGGVAMNDVLILVAIIVGWFVLNRYVLPKFGVKT
jgi:hypothetical protein